MTYEIWRGARKGGERSNDARFSGFSSQGGQLTFSVAMTGGRNGSEIEVGLCPNEFEKLARKMCEVDREAALRAFGKAMIETGPANADA